VFPIRSVVSVHPSPTSAVRTELQDEYFHGVGRKGNRRSTSADKSQWAGQLGESLEVASPVEASDSGLSKTHYGIGHNQFISEVLGEGSSSTDVGMSGPPSSGQSRGANNEDTNEISAHTTTRFQHVVTEDGHAIITGRDGSLQRCEDEPIHLPGAIQSYGLLVALQEEHGRFIVRIVSENSKEIIGYTAKQLFALKSFTDVLSDKETETLLDHIDFVRDSDIDIESSGPELFALAIRRPDRTSQKLWCAIYVTEANPGLIVCEFELEDDSQNPLVPANEQTPDTPEDILGSKPTVEELTESTENISRPLRVLRSARRRKGEAAAMEVFNIMSQVQEQLAAAPSLDTFLKVLVGVVKELTGFHRVMVYQFDKSFNGKVVTELVDLRATKDLYKGMWLFYDRLCGFANRFLIKDFFNKKGLNFPASDIPRQARELYKINRVRLLYDRDQPTARLICRTLEDLETPLDLTHSFLRAMSPIHLKYLANMAVRSSMSISINAFDELWGLVSCHGYGPGGMRVSFPIRKMCRLISDTASRTIERLSYASRLRSRKLINTAPSQQNPSGYIIASSDDLLRLFDADFGLLCIQDETKILGTIEESHEALAMLEYLRVRKITTLTTSQDITEDFPDLIYPPGFRILSGMLLVPLSRSGQDFIAFFRKGLLKDVKWAGNPYEKTIKSGTRALLEPRESFRLWSETVVSKCREWTEEEVETAAVLCLVYGKFIEVWRQKEMAVQNSQLTRLLIANSAHEVRTPLNAVINYLEIALEGALDHDTRESLVKSHSASQSLIYVINDLLDLTKMEEGGDLIKGEVIDLKSTLREATDVFSSEAKRKSIGYSVTDHPSLPKSVIGDQRKVRQAVSNIIGNAIRHTSAGEVKVDIYVASRTQEWAYVEVAVHDTGTGMSRKKLDAIFRDLEQVTSDTVRSPVEDDSKNLDATRPDSDDGNSLGLGLAIVARIIRNMNGQLRLKSEEDQGTRIVLQFPFELPESEMTENTPSSRDTSLPPSLQDAGLGEVTLVDGNNERLQFSAGIRGLLDKDNNDSISREKRRPYKSTSASSSLHSLHSQGKVDRLIEAIAGSNTIDSKWSSEPGASTRPFIDSLDTHSGAFASSPMEPTRNVETPIPTVESVGLSQTVQQPDEHRIPFEATTFRALKVPDDVRGPVLAGVAAASATHLLGDGQSRSNDLIKGASPHAGAMNVLIAEDEPINCKILTKRLEKLGHNVHVTADGEECARAYGDRAAYFDLVLMDMQVRTRIYSRRCERRASWSD
jgi:light-regulated signal transduction histidine kinase (bacteriophytochrome)